MKRLWIVIGLGLMAASSAKAGTVPANPPEASTSMEPKTPEERRAYKIGVLERWIAEDNAVIGAPSSGKAREALERVNIAKQNLKINQALLAKVKAGADHEVYFCSHCGREFMKEGTCAHCKVPTKSGFNPGAKRPNLAY
jgi:hypothetical protein